MDSTIGSSLFHLENSMSTLKKPPQVIVHHIKDADGPPFLKLRHLRCKLEYPNGDVSEEFTHDVVERKNMDACVICAYDLSDEKNPKIWLRSCVRIAVSIRAPFPNSTGCGWELPAGLIDGDENPLNASIRELEEEVGIKAPKNRARKLGRPVWGSVGLSGEQLYYYAVNVTGLKVGKPSEDGTPQERNGECILVSLDDALKVGDMKTDLGILRLKEYFRDLEIIK